MRRLLTALGVGAGALAPPTAVSAAAPSAPPRAAADGQLGIRLLDAPTNRRDDPRARIYIVDHLHQGDTISRRIEVSNTTGGPLTVQAYAAAAELKGGEFLFGTGRAANELTGWTKVVPAQLTVPAGGAAQARVTIEVPRDAPDGERYGVVWAEATSTGAGNVQSVSRVGVRIYLSVGEGKEPKSDFAVDSLQAVRRSDGSPAVLAQVHNTGARALDMRGTLQLTHGPGGLSAGPFPAQLGTTLAPGDTEPVVVPLDRAIRGGPWHAVIDLKSGLLERKAEGDITFPDAASSQNAPVKAKAVPLYKDRNAVSLFAATLIGIIALLLLLLALFGFLRRRRREEEEPAR
jgi:hypothetical protein